MYSEVKDRRTIAAVAEKEDDTTAETAAVPALDEVPGRCCSSGANSQHQIDYISIGTT